MTTPRRSITTIVHGTRPGNWWQPSKSFPQAVHSVTGDLYRGTDLFSWSGGYSDVDRRYAAERLRDWANNILPRGGFLRLICHSHGGNVAMLATRLGLRIDHLILLGTPIRVDYLPEWRNVARVHNVYVPWDWWQFAGRHDLHWNVALARFRGFNREEGRILPDLERVVNCAVVYGVGIPGHSDLYDWRVWERNQLDSLLR